MENDYRDNYKLVASVHKSLTNKNPTISEKQLLAFLRVLAEDWLDQADPYDGLEVYDNIF